MNITTLSRISSAVIFVGTIAWLAGSPAGESSSTPNATVEPLRAVEITELQPSRPVQLITLDGSTEPLHDITISAKATGKVSQVHFKTGDQVSAGSIILRLEDESQSAALARAQSEYLVSSNALSRALELSANGRVSDVQVEERKADNERKKESLAVAESTLSDTLSIAPVSGQIADIMVSPHEDVNTGAQLIRLIDNSTLVASAQMPQSQINDISVGMTSQVVFPGGVSTTGEITFISPVADFNTRSFPIEVSIQNDDLSLRSGSTVSILIKETSEPSFIIPQEALVISDEGEIGVHIIDASNVVSFQSVDITSVTADGLVVDVDGRSSLPLITKGQSTVSPGDEVAPQAGGKQ